MREMQLSFQWCKHRLSTRPRVVGSMTSQLHQNYDAMHSLHRPGVGGWATFGYGSRLHRRRVGAGQETESYSVSVAHQSAVHRHGVGGAVASFVLSLRSRELLLNPSNGIHVVRPNGSCIVAGHPQIQHSVPERDVIHVRQRHFGRRNFITYLQGKMYVVRQQRQSRHSMMFLRSRRKNGVTSFLKECRFRNAPSRRMDQHNMHSQNVLPMTAVQRFREVNVVECQRETLQPLLAAMTHQRMMLKLLGDVVFNNVDARLSNRCQTKIASKASRGDWSQNGLQSAFDRFDNGRWSNSGLSAQEKLDRPVWERVVLQNSDTVPFRGGFQIIKPLVRRRQWRQKKQRQRPSQLIRCVTVVEVVKWGRGHCDAILSQRLYLGHSRHQPSGFLRLHRPRVGGPPTVKLQQKTGTLPWPAPTLRRCSHDA